MPPVLEGGNNICIDNCCSINTTNTTINRGDATYQHSRCVERRRTLLTIAHVLLACLVCFLPYSTVQWGSKHVRYA